MSVFESQPDEMLRYLERSFERMREGAVSDARAALNVVQSQAIKAGAFQSGVTLILIREQYVRVVREVASKMSRLAFDATGSNAAEVAGIIQKSLVAVRNAVSDDLADFFRKGGSWAGTHGQVIGSDFLSETDKIIAGVVDDYRFGILGGVRLTKDPLVNVVSSITNSPGAVMQSGLGNVQQILQGDFGALRSELAKFLKSNDVEALSPEAKEAVADVADVITGELEKPEPDSSKLARWGRRLLEIAEKFGVAVAASGVSRSLFG